MKKIVVAIDGFSSCGKSTMAKALAQKINYVYVDSGAMYRALTLFALQNDLIVSSKLDESRFKALIDNIDIQFKINPESEKAETYLNGINVESEIRGMEVSNNVSVVSSYPFIRSYVDTLLRKMGENGAIVMDGRDIGTSVFPHAQMKVFVTADPMIRAERRLKELREKGDTLTSLDDVLDNIKQRDYLDQTRKESPLRQAEDAVVLDNSHLTIPQQMEWLENLFNQIINKL